MSNKSQTLAMSLQSVKNAMSDAVQALEAVTDETPVKSTRISKSKVTPIGSGSNDPLVGTVTELVENKVKLNGIPLDKNSIHALKRHHFGDAISVSRYVATPGRRGRQAEVYQLSDTDGIHFSI